MPQIEQPTQSAMDIGGDEIERADAPPVRRAAPRARTRTAVPREPVREPLREPSRGVRVEGRDGEVLSRTRRASGDPFYVPPEIIPDGWEYQWNAVSVIGNKDVLVGQNLTMWQNGWRPVPAERHAGVFMPAGYRGEIVRDGQMLMERPKALSDEARAEDLAAARQLISDRNESLMLTSVKSKLPDGFDMSNRYRGTGGDVRMSIDRALDIPTPQHQLAEPGE